MPLGPMDYAVCHHREYAAPMQRAFTNIPVLEFLWGQPWNWVALGYVHALRPTSIRVTAGGVTSDSMLWRLTVLVDKVSTSELACPHAARMCPECLGWPTIRRITQEVEIGVYPERVNYGGHPCGASHDAAFRDQGGKK